MRIKRQYRSIACILFAFTLCIGCAKTPAPSLAEFICTSETETLTPDELKQKEKRTQELERALERTIGIEFEGHGFKFFQIGAKTCRVYDLQRKLTLQDWELLAEMFAENYEEWNTNEHNKAVALVMSFNIRGEEAINILECEINNRGLSDRFSFF
ncbi:MAG: hypothetical protein LBI57_01895 [Helicobacteraceae bacterium]|jgi:hypothetical protein|nr:hypothetical protein [Helicobacteraceae bacterium]